MDEHHLHQHAPESFRHDPPSPVSAQEREAFDGLRSFLLDRELVLDVPIEPATYDDALSRLSPPRESCRSAVSGAGAASYVA